MKDIGKLEVALGVFIVVALAAVLAILLWPKKEEETAGSTVTQPPPTNIDPEPSDVPTQPPPTNVEPLEAFCTTGCYPTELAALGETLAISVQDPAGVNSQILSALTSMGALNAAAPVSVIAGFYTWDDGFFPNDEQMQQLIDIILAAPLSGTRAPGQPAGPADTDLSDSLMFDISSNGGTTILRFTSLFEDITPPVYSDTFINTGVAKFGYALAYGAPCSSNC